MTLPVSIVIPMLNEAATLPSLFAALRAQAAFPAEVIFVDAGSRDGSPDMVFSWWKGAAWEGGECRVISCPGAMPGAGRNAGIANAGNEWIAFLDAGIQPEPEWLKIIFGYVQKQGVNGVFGLCRFSADAPVAKAICALSYGCGTMRPVLPASIFHRGVFERVGMFVPDARAGEDILWLNAYEAVYGPRKICQEAIVDYRFFPGSIARAAKKWFIYEIHVAVAGLGGKVKIIQMLPWLAVIGGALINRSVGLALFFVYAITRGVIDPIRRSTDRPWWGKTRVSIAIALISGPLLDAAKLGGYLTGMLRKILR